MKLNNKKKTKLILSQIQKLKFFNINIAIKINI